MPVTAPLEFWFEFASTYSYPAAMRIERDEREQQDAEQREQQSGTPQRA